MSVPQNRLELARLIDHTALKPETTRAQIDKLCDECLQYGFVAACIEPVWVSHCVRRLAGGRTLVCTVAGFPLGTSTSQTKAYEAQRAVEHGALEVDMVIHVGELIGGDETAVEKDVRTVVDGVKRANPNAIVKVILETRALTDTQIIAACRCCAVAGADFVKTSTGFHANGGATIEHVALLRKHSQSANRGGGRMLVKAAGGIRDLKTALAMIEAGADRIGASASVAILNEMPA